MKRLRRVISRQSTNEIEAEDREPSFLGIDRWPLLGRSQRRRDASPHAILHRPSQSFSVRNDWRQLRESKHKRTSSSSSIFSKHTRRASFAAPPTLEPQPCMDFIGYPPGGLEIQRSGLVLRCEQKSPDVCEYTVRRDAMGLRVSDILAIALVSWAAHVFFRGPLIFACVPMLLYIVRSSLQVCQESLTVVRNVGIQTSTTTVAGFRHTRSYESQQIKDFIIHEALQLLEYRYYMAIMPIDPSQKIVIMFPHLLPKLDELLPVYHGTRMLLFS
ncbi:hypothetical protein GGH19_004329 [Coemansia sp. RSA 1807]|nr:hypothetical protein LPJ67_003212 [Coemansia sp. RSA 1938]KAJ2140210.1 hypothetical protein IW142_005508 [Coemansia sp. RSA 564]KAJ2194623.1 hypothetical protein GGH18_002171 [Coemansia sp. RSA 530]KAJ2292948.1 hypothetical protein IW141_001552 [Coemansia sp. RSA 355]KAJ2408209.1 hypothetical protein J3F80_002268 [Coemansia sp. RSA 2526]KAJ2432819.1 hypothetical protein IWW46_006540 [Coemansia sp. RSA 2440]KAJ2573780.1 hypothetical protein GGH19_004329 [Coemansia sp. RSA 1807]KAJ2652866.1